MAIFIHVISKNVQQAVVDTRFLSEGGANSAVFAPNRHANDVAIAQFVRTRHKSIVGDSSDMERNVEFRIATDAAVGTKSCHGSKIVERAAEGAKILDFVNGERRFVHVFVWVVGVALFRLQFNHNKDSGF